MVNASPPLKTVSFPPVDTQAYLFLQRSRTNVPLPMGVSVRKVPPTLVPLYPLPEVSAIVPWYHCHQRAIHPRVHHG